MKKYNQLISGILLTIALVLIIHSGVVAEVFDIMGGPNFSIVIPDDFYNNIKLSQYVSLRESQGYIVEVKKLSDIYAQYPVSNTITFLKIRSIENIEADFNLWLYWFDGSKFICSSYFQNGVFHKGVSPTLPKEISIFTREQAYNYRKFYFTVTYDGGHKVTLLYDFNNFYATRWGIQYFTSDKTLAFYKTNVDSIRQYLISIPNLDYALLLGNINKIPSYYIRDNSFSGSSYVFDHSFTDLPFAVREINVNNYPYPAVYWDYMNPDFAIGRLPVADTVELENVLTKVMEYRPNRSKETTIFLGDPSPIDSDFWNENYNAKLNALTSCLPNYYQEMKITSVIEGSKTQILNALNNENDFVVWQAHGHIVGANIGTFNNGISTTDMFSISFQNSTVIFADSCYNGDFSYDGGHESLAEAFITDSDSKCVAFFGSSREAYTDKVTSLCVAFFDSIGQYRTIGKTWKQAQWEITDIFTLLEFNMFSDPTIDLMEGITYPPPSPPPRSYLRWLEIMSSIALIGVAIFVMR